METPSDIFDGSDGAAVCEVRGRTFLALGTLS